MSRFAKVTSTDAVDRLTAALHTFREEAAAALDNLELEIRRAVRWLKHDQKEYWNQQVRRGWNQVAEARANLEHAMTCRKTSDYTPACREEKLELEKAKRRLRQAEEKVETVRHWSREVEHELTEYRGSINQVAGWIQADYPRAVAALKRMSAALESYLAVQSPAGAAAPAASVALGTAEDAVDGAEETTPPEEETAATKQRPSENPSDDEIERTSSGSIDDEKLGPAHGGHEPGGGDGVAPGGEARNDGAMG